MLVDEGIASRGVCSRRLDLIGVLDEDVRLMLMNALQGAIQPKATPIQ